MRKSISGLFCFLLLYIGVSSAQVSSNRYTLQSPNQTIKITINTGHQVTYSVRRKGRLLLKNNPLSLSVKGRAPFGTDATVKDTVRSQSNRVIRPVVPYKKREIANRYNQLKITFERPYSLIFRAYDEGAAYRFSLNIPDSVKIVDEQVAYNFTGNYRTLYPRQHSLQSHYENQYTDTTLGGLPRPSFSDLPLTVQTPGRTTLSISESDVFDYPHLFLEVSGAHSFSSKFPQKVLQAKSTSDRNQKITRKADYIASVNGKRLLPWRAVKINKNAGELLENTLFYKLARPPQIENTDWINPGKVAWDWWHARNIYNVPFQAGINTATYKHYIDFAAARNLDYVILDEGWSNNTDLSDVNPQIDIPELVRYGQKRDVGLILWMLWKPLRDHLQKNMRQFEEWGIKGIKVDFMQRADQDMVQFYERVAREAAEHRILVNFHGAFKPAGLRRAYPNVMSYEGVMGLEHSKWGDAITPEHDVILPFTRMAAGPMDYTPGAMVNAHPRNFRAVYTRPMSQGTRAHQVAMYVIYQSGLQMLSDSPTHYREEAATTSFISRIPVTWHETRVLDARLAEHLIMARRHNDTWYIGGMTGERGYSTRISLDFLEKDTTYTATIFEDGINADRYAEDFKKYSKSVIASDSLHIQMVSGGGWAAILEAR